VMSVRDCFPPERPAMARPSGGRNDEAMRRCTLTEIS
jgi:hypothetical protein